MKDKALKERIDQCTSILRGESCVGCAFLYKVDEGYSDYTVTDTNVHCALDMNRHLATKDTADPYDWNMDEEHDNWAHTKNSRCHRYQKGPLVRFNVEWRSNFTTAHDVELEGTTREVAEIIFAHVRGTTREVAEIIFAHVSG